MSKAIRSYPEHLQQSVIDRRVRVYDPKGHNGMGTLAAKNAYDKKLLNRSSKPKKVSNEEKAEK